MAFASPGVSIKEVDLTPTINVSDQNVAAVVIAAETGPVDTVTYITSEKELVDTFGTPNNDNYESWFAALTIIQYGGIAAVVRPTSSSIVLNSSSDAGLTSFIIKSKFDYDNYTGTAFKFAGRSAGTKLNSLKVVAVDHGADQIITYTGADPTVSAGDAIIIKKGSTTVGTGWIYKSNTTDNTLHIILNDSTKRIPTSDDPTNGYPAYSITDNAGTPVTLIAAGAISAVPDNSYYDTLEYASGLKWRDIAPQPGTSSSVASKGGKFDEMHIVVLDEDGLITGTANTILEKYLFVSKAKDASTLDGSLVYFHNSIAERSKYVFPGYSTGIDFVGASKITLEGETNAVIGEANSSNKIYSSIVSNISGTVTTATDSVAVTGVNTNFKSELSAGSQLYTTTGRYIGTVSVVETNTALTLTQNANAVVTAGTVNTGLSTIGFSLTGGTDYRFADDTADVTAAIDNGYELFRDSESFNDIDFLIPGAISRDRAVKLIDIAESRRDCIAVISPRRSDVINSSTSGDKTEKIVDFFSEITSSSFAMFDSGYKYIYDKFNDTYRYVPCAADVAGLCINTTINSETWFSPAGYNRGNLRNATKLAYSPKQSERDRLYTNRINPIVSFPGQGIVLFGDKTALSSPSAFNRINVRRLFIELEKNVARFSKFQLFEINDEVTRSSFKSAVEPYLRGVQGRRGIYDFLVVCDETNNTADVIDRNEFNAEIYVKPARSINFITITFVATRTGISFGELTQ